MAAQACALQYENNRECLSQDLSWNIIGTLQQRKNSLNKIASIQFLAPSTSCFTPRAIGLGTCTPAARSCSSTTVKTAALREAYGYRLFVVVDVVGVDVSVMTREMTLRREYQERRIDFSAQGERNRKEELQKLSRVCEH